MLQQSLIVLKNFAIVCDCKLNHGRKFAAISLVCECRMLCFDSPIAMLHCISLAHCDGDLRFVRSNEHHVMAAQFPCDLASAMGIASDLGKWCQTLGPVFGRTIFCRFQLLSRRFVLLNFAAWLFHILWGQYWSAQKIPPGKFLAKSSLIWQNPPSSTQQKHGHVSAAGQDSKSEKVQKMSLNGFAAFT